MCIRDRAYGYLRFAQVGFPIRISPDQWIFAPPRSFSQLITCLLYTSIKCSCRYKQCQRRVKSTGNTDNCALAMGMRQTFFQSHSLNI